MTGSWRPIAVAATASVLISLSAQQITRNTFTPKAALQDKTGTVIDLDGQPHEWSLDRLAPKTGAALFEALERRFGPNPARGHAYVVTAKGIIPCFGVGPDDNAPLPCEAAVAESAFASCRQVVEEFHVEVNCGREREKYEQAKRAAEYCGICGPTGPLGPEGALRR